MGREERKAMSALGQRVMRLDRLYLAADEALSRWLARPSHRGRRLYLARRRRYELACEAPLPKEETAHA